MRSQYGVRLKTTQFQVRGLIHSLRDFRGVFWRSGSGAMIAHIQVDQNFQFLAGSARGFLIPGDLLEVIDHHHRSCSYDSRHLDGVGDWRCQQQSGNPGGSHQLGLGHRRHANADRTCRDLPFGDLHALVSFRVRPQRLAGFLDAGGHAREVGIELVQVQDEGGRGQLLLSKHQPIMQNAILGSLKLVQVVVPSEPPVDAAALQKELERQIQGEVRFDTITRALYSTDASVYLIRPLGVAIPKNREDVIRIVQICGRMRCPLTMRGGGTSQAGQAIGEGLQVDISKYFNRVLEVNAEERWARVEPGVVLDELNAQLAPLGLRFAPDISTASRATIGGMMANNSAGARSVLYGKTIDHVLEQTVVLADGSIAEFREISRTEVPTGDSLEANCYETVLRLAAEHADEIDRRYPKVIRRVGGYNLDNFVDLAKTVNLAKMMVGSEGTLGVVLEAKLRLVPLPKAKAVMVIAFTDLLEALSATPVILRHGPSAVEVMDKAILDNTRQNANLDRIRKSFIHGDPAATLCVEFYGDKKEDLPPRLGALEEDLRARNLGYRYHSDTDPVSQARIWSLREAALGLSMAMKDDAKSISFVEDTAVAPEKLSEYIGRFLEIVRTHGTTAGVYAHASVGCLHVRPVVNMKTEEGVAKFASLAQAVADLVLEFGGALSGEHGDGLVRGPFMRQMFGDTLYEAFREIKRTFDPRGIFNPGKIVDAPPLTSNLRFGAGYQTPNPTTWFDFSEYGGFGGAVEMCSGLGACRKKLSGTMCPSYMATRDEKDSTRGRANTLRLAMTGKLGESGLGDKGVYEVLDLCLECRACKAECPVGVDMARFKSEFLADYWTRHGTSLRARALGGIADASVWGSRCAPVSNWVAGAVSNMIGIDNRRKLPAWKRQTFARRRAGLSPRGALAPLGRNAVQRHLHQSLRS